MTGVAGLPAGRQRGGLTTYQFPTQDSITLLAVVFMGGVYSFWGAVVAGRLHEAPAGAAGQLEPAARLLLILFGVGVLQVLLTAPQGSRSSSRRTWPSSGRADARPFDADSGRRGGCAVIEISDLTVQFGGVMPLDERERRVPGRAPAG